MVRRRVLFPSYLSIGLAITTGLAANLASVLPARAQADLNIQNRLDIIVPPVPVQQPTNNGPNLNLAGLTVRQKITALKNAGCDLPAGVAAIIAKELKKAPPVGQQAWDMLEAYKKTTDDEKKFEEKLAGFFPINTNCLKRQPTNVQISFPFNPTYETNILKSGNNSSPGQSAGFGSSVQVTSGVNVEGILERPWDLVILNAQEGSSRYTPNFSPSTDAFSQQASYQMFLYAYGLNPDTKSYVSNLAPGKPNPPLPAGTTTFDTLTFSVLNQTGFAPTFRNEKSDFLTPQASFAIQNIGLGDLSPRLCGTVTQNSDGTKNDSRSFCNYLNLSLTAGQSFSDVRTLENVNLAASATLGWKLTDDGAWGLTLPATATARDYEYAVGGRRDLQLQVGPVLSYSSTPDQRIYLHCPTKTQDPTGLYGFCTQEYISYTFKLPITYYKNYSTLSTAAWSGWVIMPTLTFSFNWSETNPINQKP